MRTPSSRPRTGGPEFADQVLTGATGVVPGSVFERCRFDRVTLQGTDLSRCRFVECRFDGSNLAAARVTDCELRGVTFAGSKASGIDWTTARRFARVAFEDCVLDQSAFLRMDLRHCVLRRCRLREAVFAEADLTDADLSGSDLTDALFLRTKLVRADLRGATGYSIDARVNDVTGLRVTLPEGLALLAALGVEAKF